MKSFNLSEWALDHRSLVVYLMLICAVAGLWSYTMLGRDEDPPFTIKTMVVKTVWPGATEEETLNQITDRIEKKLEELPSLDNLRSYTKAGESVVFVTLRDDTAPEDVPDLWYQVRKKTEDIRRTLPADVHGPFFNDEFGDTFGIIYAFTADGFSHRELKDYVETVRAEIIRLPDVGKSELIGVQEERVTVEFSTKRLAALGVGVQDAIAAIQMQNAVAPAGVINLGQERVLLRVGGGFASSADLAHLNLRVHDRFVRLADVAEIHYGYADPPMPQYRVNGRPAIGLAVSMVKGGDNLRMGENISRRMAELERVRPVGIDAILVADQPNVVRHSVQGFLKSLTEAVAIILAVSFLSLGLRAGAVVALSIPLVLAATFICMSLFDISLQRVSLGALIIALGLLVDDAMITTEMMVKKLEEGFSLRKAATFAYTSTAFPMLTGTLVTVIGFVPVGFAESAAGEYCISLFSVVALALLISWVVAVLFSPMIGVAILPKTIKPHAQGGIADRMSQAFRRLLLICLRHRRWVLLGTGGLFLISLAGATKLEQQFFPPSDRPELLVNLTLPHGASIAATGAAVEILERRLAQDSDVASYTVNVGAGAVRFYLPMDLQLEHDYFAQAVVVTKNAGARAAMAARLQEQLSQELPDAVVRAAPLELGPPVGWPLKYRISGPDAETVRQAAFELAGVIAGHSASRAINFDWNEPIKVARLTVLQDQARLRGLSSQDIAAMLNTTFSGAAATELRDGTYLIDVLVRAGTAERNDLETLRQLQIPIPRGGSVPLGAVARLDYGVEQPIVWRYQRLPAITVQADLASGVQAVTAVKELAPAMAVFAAKLPLGYELAVGGIIEESAKAQDSINAVMPLMVLLMLTVLMVQLQSFQLLLLVMSVAPLGLVGVVAALLPTHTPMGFVATLGCIALIGMIVRNSVILIDQIEQDIAAGMDRWTAVVEATCHRMRPILLTAAAAILGMVPIASEAFWGPMAYAIMGGLVVATLLTLLFLPTAYVAWFRIKEPAERPSAGSDLAVPERALEGLPM